MNNCGTLHDNAKQKTASQNKPTSCRFLVLYFFISTTSVLVSLMLLYFYFILDYSFFQITYKCHVPNGFMSYFSCVISSSTFCQRKSACFVKDFHKTVNFHCGTKILHLLSNSNKYPNQVFVDILAFCASVFCFVFRDAF